MQLPASSVTRAPSGTVFAGADVAEGKVADNGNFDRGRKFVDNPVDVFVVGMVEADVGELAENDAAHPCKRRLLTKLQQHSLNAVAFFVDVFQQQDCIRKVRVIRRSRQRLQNAEVGADQPAFGGAGLTTVPPRISSKRPSIARRKLSAV